MKRSIGFFINSNGYGHYNRCMQIASFLKKDIDITFYGKVFQYNKIGHPGNATFIASKEDTIRWDKSLKGNRIRFKSYINGIKEHKKLLKKHDAVISDNIVGILKYRTDAIISGSFFWKDVYFDKFGPNKLSDFDNELLVKHNPLVITNKYFETGNVKNYNHKLQLGIGCKQKEYSYSTTNRVLFIEPSLNYINSYRDFVKKLYNYEVSTDIKDINNCVLVARPGGGIITYCIEKQIPLVALYDENDSNEILELADKIEELGIGKKHNTNDHFTNPYKDNSIFDSLKIEDNGFKLTADYINKLF